jgi:hypothetical protein
MSHVLRTLAMVIVAQTLYACVNTPPAARSVTAQACRTSEVLYCSANGSREAGDMCVCLDQSAAKATVDSL